MITARDPPGVHGGREDRLGEILVREGWITAEQRDWATRVQEETGCRLGAILVAAGLVRRTAVYRVLARTWGCDYVDLADAALDLALLDGLDAHVLAEEGWLPYRRDGDRLRVATSERPTAERQKLIEDRLGERVELVVTTDWDILRSLHRAYRESVVEQSTLGLWLRDPGQSARQVLVGGQRVLLGLALAASAAGLVLAPRATLSAAVVLASVGVLAATVFTVVVGLVGARRERPGDAAASDPRDLPTYTVLVPLHREAAAVADLVAHLDTLDYPREKLEILLLLEEDDTETIAAARAARPPSTITFLIVPPGHPRTRPKACNVGLFFARGEFVVVYDADDRPEPDQLRKAVAAFRRGGDHLVCVQAALSHGNPGTTWLTRLSAAEQSFRSGLVLPGLARLRLPVPIGGSSGHFRTRGLRMLGGWDPFNVTDGADLGIRAAARGRTVGVLGSTTSEEANGTPGDWVRRRSRWVKGDMQTLLVHLRRPRALVRTVGGRRAVAFLLLVGGPPLTLLVTPLLYALLLVPALVPGWALGAGLVGLLGGTGLMIYASMMGAFTRRDHALVLRALLLTPAYVLLHSVAAYRALGQLVTKPHYWEKSVHGLSHPAQPRPDAADRAPTPAG